MDDEVKGRPWWRGRRGGPSRSAVTLIVGSLGIIAAVITTATAGGPSGTVDSHGDGNANVVGDGNSIVVNNYGPGAAAPSPSPTSADASLCGDADSGVFGGWGPERPMFARARQPDFATLNAIRDNEDVGDERGFVRVRDLTTNGTFEHEAELVPGHRYELMLYVHESSAGSSDGRADGGPTIAVNLPTCAGNRIAVNGFISSEQTFPGEVYDGATLTSKRTFNVAYVVGTARVVNSAHPDGQAVHEPERTLFTATGIGFGLDSYDPGDDNAGYVLFSVDPQFAPA